MANLAREDQTKRTVHVNREKLIATLTENRKRHAEQYAEAVQGYREQAIEKLKIGHEQAIVKLEKNLQQGIAKLNEFDADNPRGTSDYLVLVEQISVELRVPRNYVKEYDAAIDMATWDVRPELELTHAEFQCFVRDVWDWTNEFAAITSIYNNKKFS